MGGCCTVLDVSNEDPYIIEDLPKSAKRVPSDGRATRPSARCSVPPVMHYSQPALSYEVYGISMPTQYSSSPPLGSSTFVYSAPQMPGEYQLNASYPALTCPWECTVPVPNGAFSIQNDIRRTQESPIPYCTPRTRPAASPARFSPEPRLTSFTTPSSELVNSQPRRTTSSRAALDDSNQLLRLKRCSATAQVRSRSYTGQFGYRTPETVPAISSSGRAYRCTRSPVVPHPANVTNINVAPPPQSPTNTLCNTPVPALGTENEKVEQNILRANKPSYASSRTPSYVRQQTPPPMVPRCVRKPTITRDASSSNDIGAARSYPAKLPERVFRNT